MAISNTISRNAIILGATGLVGNALCNQILEANIFNTVRAWVRQPHTLKAPIGVTEVVVNYENPITWQASLLGCTDVFCCLGTTMAIAGSKSAFYKVDFTYPVAVAEQAKLAGVINFHVISSIGANAQSNNFYLSVKGKLETMLSTFGFKHLNIFRPSLLLGERKKTRLAETIMLWFTPLMFGPLRKYKPVYATQVAQSMLYMANRNDLPGTNVIASDSIRQLN